MSPKPPRNIASTVSSGRWFAVIGLLLMAIVLASSCCHTWVSSLTLATNFVSPATWAASVGMKSAELQRPAWPDEAKVGFASVAVVVAVLILATWLCGSFWLARKSGRSLVGALASWGIYGSVWWCLIGVWEWTWIAAGIVGWESFAVLLTVTPQFWLACCVSGWITTLFCLSVNPSIPDREGTPLSSRWLCNPALRWVWIACGLYVVTFTTMNWRLYFNLLIPHGDSAMYEEHLWNVLHGKGFRSYLDQGLFFGEHIQFVHLFLIPLYVFWPSHLLLELSESTALAFGSFPVFWMTRRQTGSDRTALAVAVAYLLYAPMQFLDIEIDLKTFRPEAFGIPLLLLTLDQLDRRNLRGLLIGLAFTLTVKEDYALVFGPLGLWILWHEFGGWPLGGRGSRRAEMSNGSPMFNPGSAGASPSQLAANVIRWRAPSSGWIATGVAMSIGSVAYLWLATRLVIPWFRSGAELHYVRYFPKFGKTPEQIIYTMLTKPGLLYGELVTTATILYAIAMLVPVAFLALLSPGRLAVGAPLFGVLCLNELAKDPRHQFHAPLVAIVFWSVAHAMPRAERGMKWLATWFGRLGPSTERAIPILPRTLLWTSTLTTGVFMTLSPLGISFWDPGSSYNWRQLYGPSRRAELFVHVPPLIPQSSRVASTDFVHPRFTHHDRSYDYSGYLREVSNYQKRVPDDTDFIVIDTQHPYSEIKRPDEILEYRDHPDQWELLPDETEGFFIVLRRRH